MFRPAFGCCNLQLGFRKKTKNGNVPEPPEIWETKKLFPLSLAASTRKLVEIHNTYANIIITGDAIGTIYIFNLKRDSNLRPKPLSLLEFEIWWLIPLGHHGRFTHSVLVEQFFSLYSSFSLCQFFWSAFNISLTYSVRIPVFQLSFLSFSQFYWGWWIRPFFTKAKNFNSISNIYYSKAQITHLRNIIL